MKVSVLSSGSKGNVTYVHTDSLDLLIDLGPTCSYVENTLESLNVNPKDIKAILVTHTHSDHIKGLKVFAKKYNPTIYLTEKMLKDLNEIFPVENYVLIEKDFDIENIHVDVIKTSHDASDSNAYIVEEGDSSVVYITDTGFINQKYFNVLKNRSVYIMESNHDIEMILNGRYPYHLRQRVLSDRGHLSNIDSAHYLKDFIGPKTKQVFLAHLSEENNTPSLALQTLSGVLEEYGVQFKNISIAKQNEKTELITL
jgi:phosphoribosyl 1,2-cyclic phosphodiesterase